MAQSRAKFFLETEAMTAAFNRLKDEGTFSSALDSEMMNYVSVKTKISWNI